MGSSVTVEKSAIETLCSQIILAKAESQYGSVESSIIQSLTQLRRQIQNPELRPGILKELKEGRKGIPSLIYCMMWKGPINDENNDVRLFAFETFYIILQVDPSLSKILFEQEMLGPINKICLTAKPEFKYIGVKILHFLTQRNEYYNELYSFNPLYTMNSLMLASSSSVNQDTRMLALKGIENLADTYKSEYVLNGIINTLLNSLNENKYSEETGIIINCLAKSADEPSVAKCLIDEHFPDIIDKYLAHSGSDVRSAAALSVQALCKVEKARDIIHQSSLKILYSLSKNPEITSRMAAKSALLSLCLNEAKLNYFTKKKWVESILDTFNEINNDVSKENVGRIIYQLSTECLKYTLHQLFLSLTRPLFALVQDLNEMICGLALSALVNLTVRLDLQSEYQQFAEVIVKIFDRLTTMTNRVNAMIILSILSVKNNGLINQTFYTNFFFSKADRSQYSFVGNPEASDTSKDIEEQKEHIEYMVKLARITCVSFPSNEVQSIMNEKLKFINSHCRSFNTKIRYRAVGTLAVMALRESLRTVLYNNEFFETIMLTLSDYEDEVKLVACYALRNILTSPDGLKLWLKFDSSFVIDASNNYILACPVKNLPLKKNTGIYAGWGKEVLKSEIIIIQDFLKLKEWTIMAWFRVPLPSGDKILVQGKSGTGAVVGANDDYFYVVDKKTGAELPVWTGLNELKKGWHHLCVSLNSESRVLARVDYECTRSEKEVSLEESFKYFVNDKKGKKPFGVVCDLRVYERCLTGSEIKDISIYNENIVFGLPDKFCEYANVADIPTVLIQLIKKENDVVKISALQALSFLATKSSCRASMLRNSIIPLIVSLIRNVNLQVSEYSAKCLMNLG